MSCRSIALTLFACVAPTVRGTIIVSVDKLDSTDGVSIPPPHLVGVDVGVTLSSSDAFYAVGINGVTASGAELIYAHSKDGVIPTAPGIQNRFVTFFSEPRARDTDERFDDRGWIHMVGSFCYQPPTPDYLPEQVNAAATAPISPDGLSGYVLRIVIDLSAVAEPAFRADSHNILVAMAPPLNSTTLFQTTCQELDGGAFVVSEDRQFDPTYFEFGIYGVLLGDLDGDGDVDLTDLTALLANFGTPSGAGLEDGDLDFDGDVDLRDLVRLLANFGPALP